MFFVFVQVKAPKDKKDENCGIVDERLNLIVLCHTYQEVYTGKGGLPVMRRFAEPTNRIHQLLIR